MNSWSGDRMASGITVLHIAGIALQAHLQGMLLVRKGLTRQVKPLWVLEHGTKLWWHKHVGQTVHLSMMFWFWNLCTPSQSFFGGKILADILT